VDDAAYNPVEVPAAMSGQGFPLGVRADGEMTRKGIAFAFILGTIAVFFAFPLGLLGIVLSNMGMNRVSAEPDTARKLVAWSWAVFAVTDCIIVPGILVSVFSR
jgi:hypothetical protein